MILSESMTVWSLWAMVRMVQSAKQLRIVSWMRASVLKDSHGHVGCKEYRIHGRKAKEGLF